MPVTGPGLNLVRHVPGSQSTDRPHHHSGLGDGVMKQFVSIIFLSIKSLFALLKYFSILFSNLGAPAT